MRKCCQMKAITWEARSKMEALIRIRNQTGTASTTADADYGADSAGQSDAAGNEQHHEDNVDANDDEVQVFETQVSMRPSKVSSRL